MFHRDRTEVRARFRPRSTPRRGRHRQEARDLAKKGPNIRRQGSLIAEGLKAVKTLAGEGSQNQRSPCAFNALQALMAAKAGPPTYRRSWDTRRYFLRRDGRRRGDRDHLRQLRIRHGDHSGLGAQTRFISSTPP
jgi:hypothetical protein